MADGTLSRDRKRETSSSGSIFSFVREKSDTERCFVGAAHARTHAPSADANEKDNVKNGNVLVNK